MSVENIWYVGLVGEVANTVLALKRRAEGALHRARKLPPGDRSESIRFDALHTGIDQIAIAAVHMGASFLSVRAPDGPGKWAGSLGIVTIDDQQSAQLLPAEVQQWLREGKVVVMLDLPHGWGETRWDGKPGTGPSPPAKRWHSERKGRAAALRERFEYLMTKVPDQEQDIEAAIRPSGISNKVLTEALRDRVAAVPDRSSIKVPVHYRDGSSGPDFPSGCVSLSDELPQGWRELSFSLLSIRHVQMDVLVDGAWLSNPRVSVPHPAGDVDRQVYETSIRQLRRIAKRPTIVHMYQTGLETAVIGFYRAVTMHLRKQPGSIAVQPHYFRGENAPFEKGTPWTTE